MSTWRVRREGATVSAELPSAQAVVDALRDGVWSGEDEVRGPGEPAWQSLEDHPQFAGVVAELEPPKPPPEDEARLDMNPLIDVALVLLIFFILTTSYATLRRAIDLPEAPTEEQGKVTQVQKPEDIRDRVFKVKVMMGDSNTVLVQVEEKTVPLADAEKEITAAVKGTGKREMYLDVAGDVPWGAEARIYDIAKGLDVRQIYLANQKK
jgi:biopolymer transport protein ExbD